MHLSFSLDRSAMTIIITLIMIMLIFIAIMQSSLVNIALLLSLAGVLVYGISNVKSDPFFANSDTQVFSHPLSKHLCGGVNTCNCHVMLDDSMNIPITTIMNEPTSAESCDRSGYFDRATDRGELADQYSERNKDVQALVGEKNPTDAYPWSSNQGYTECYPGPNRELNGCNINDYMGIDEANTRQVAMRTRDKKVLDGYVSKNANYYKRHFSKELDESENKRWWGNDNY